VDIDIRISPQSTHLLFPFSSIFSLNCPLLLGCYQHMIHSIQFALLRNLSPIACSVRSLSQLLVIIIGLRFLSDPIALGLRCRWNLPRTWVVNCDPASLRAPPLDSYKIAETTDLQNGMDRIVIGIDSQ
jgi:hypothetical protein